VTEYHQRVVDVAHDAGELELEDRVEGKDDAVPVDLVVLAGMASSYIRSVTPDPCRGRGTCGAAPWPRGPETEWPASTQCGSKWWWAWSVTREDAVGA